MSVKGHRSKPGDTRRWAGPTRVAPRGAGDEQGRGHASVPPSACSPQGGAVGTRAHSRMYTSRLALRCPPPLSPGPWGGLGHAGGPERVLREKQPEPAHGQGKGLAACVPHPWAQGARFGACTGAGWGSPALPPPPHSPPQWVWGAQHHPCPRGGGSWVSRMSGSPPHLHTGSPPLPVTLRRDVGKSQRLTAVLGGAEHPKKPCSPSMAGGGTHDSLPRDGLAGSHRTKTLRPPPPPKGEATQHTAVPCPGPRRSPSPPKSQVRATHPL